MTTVPDDNYVVEKLAPHSMEAEEALLGAILLNPDVMVEVGWLEEEDFFIVRNGMVWSAIKAVYKRDRGEVNNVSLIDYLRQQPDPHFPNQLEALGGGSYLTYLINNTPTSLHADVYAEIIDRARLRRMILSFATDTAQLATSGDRDIDEVLADISNGLQAIVDRRAGRTRVEDTNEDYVERRRQGRAVGIQADVIPVPDEWGLNRPGTDQILCKRRLTGLVSYSHAGKTTMAVQIATEACLSGYPVLYLTMEATADRIRDQVLACMLKTTTKYITNPVTDTFRPSNPNCNNPYQPKCREGDPLHRELCGCYKHYEFEKYLAAAENTLVKMPLWVEDQSLTPEQARGLIFHHVRTNNVALVVIDHFYQFRKPGNVNNLNVFESGAIRTLVETCKEANVAGLVLLQTRKTESNKLDKHPPTPARIRGASEIFENLDACISFARTPIKDSNGETVFGADGTFAMIKLRGADHLFTRKMTAVLHQSRFDLIDPDGGDT